MLASIRRGIATGIEELDRELAEIGLLVQQTRLDSERHEGRRHKGEERVAALEGAPRPDIAAISDAKGQLIQLTRRAAVMEAQQQILEGKQRSIQRFRDRMAALDAELDKVPQTVGHGEPAGLSPGGLDAGEGPRVILRAQEEMRREIARQMHDGPAQSLANIALQSEIVQRLIGRDPARAGAEVEQLRRMVQHALEQTKTFIFDVRPMVLDDLGLVPTLRRAARDRGKHAGLAVIFDSVGTDRRLTPEVEAGFFRIVDDALVGYIGLRPKGLTVRLDWLEGEVRATVSNGDADERASDARATSDERQSEAEAQRDDMPPALAEMIRAQHVGQQQARTVAHAMPLERWRDIEARADALGVSVELTDEGRTLEVLVATPG